MAVSERRIRAEVALGARSVDDIGERCGAGRECGGCRPVIADILTETSVKVSARIAAVA